jgi:hypothetical protein
MKRALPFALALGVVLAIAAPARAAVLVVPPSAELFPFYGGNAVAVAPAGGPLTLINADTGVPHSVVSRATRPDGTAPWCTAYDTGRCPLFWSAETASGPSAVLGLEDTVAGTQYDFYCGVHAWMTATLVVA